MKQLPPFYCSTKLFRRLLEKTAYLKKWMNNDSVMIDNLCHKDECTMKSWLKLMHAICKFSEWKSRRNTQSEEKAAGTTRVVWVAEFIGETFAHPYCELLKENKSGWDERVT